MKKLLLIVIVSVSLFSCSQTPKEKLLSRVDKMANTELVPNLKDPKSFEKKEVTLDTITTKKWILEMMNSNVDRMKENLDHSNTWIDLDLAKAKEYMNENIPLKKENDSLAEVLKHTSDTSIVRIEINYYYRAKNGFGALDVQNTKFCYIPKDDNLIYWGK